MKRLLFLLLLLPLLGNAQITLPTIPNLVVCDDTDNNGQDGQKTINIMGHINPFLTDFPAPQTYIIEAYTTLATAEAGADKITNTTNYIATNGQTLYIRVENAATVEFAIATFTVVINAPTLLNVPTPLVVCEDSFPNDGITTFDLTVKNNEITGPNCIGCIVTFYEQHPLYPDSTPIANPTAYINPPPNHTKTLYVKVQNASGCISYKTLTIKYLPLPAITGNNSFATLYSCNGIYNLTVNNALVGTNTTITYFTTQDNANLNINPIANPQAYTGGTPVWARLSLDTNNPAEPKCARVVVQNLQSVSSAATLTNGSICVNYTSGQTEAAYLLDTGINGTGWTFSWTRNGNILSGNSSTYLASVPGTYSVTATHSATGCSSTASATVTVSGPAQVIGSGYIIEGQTIVANVEGYGQYQYKMDEGSYQQSGGFDNVTYGNHLLYANDLKGCGTLTVPVFIAPPAPTGNPEYFFTEGETVANLTAIGQYIQWYAQPTGGLPLPTTTPLVNGLTYYASQTLNDTESTERLAVTIHTGFQIGIPNNLLICVPMGESVGAFDLTSNSEILLNDLNPAEYTIEFTAGDIDDFYPIQNPSQYICLVSGQVVVAKVTKNDNPYNYRWASFSLTVDAIPSINTVNTITVVTSNSDNTAIVDLTQTIPEILGNQPADITTITFYTTLTDAEAGIATIANPENFIAQTQSIYFRLQRSQLCYSTSSFNIIITTIVAPTGASDQTFTEGETLADLEVEGENIQWYDNDGNEPTPDDTNNSLPLTTLLVDGTTYYATQTINGIESSQRLAVTVNLTAGINDYAFITLQYYPNPASNILNIENATDIDSVSLTNALGQKALSKTINSNTAQIDISPLSKGVYFVTVALGSASKTIKIIKE